MNYPKFNCKKTVVIMKLSKEELQRYSRQILLPEVGLQGQEKIKEAKVLVIGAGGLGCPALQYLAAAGTGTIGIVDFDLVDETNLHRQILFNTNDIGKPKALVAAQKLKMQNHLVNCQVHQEKLESSNALKIIKNYDIVIDGSDNFPTKYLVNDACVMLNKPLVFGSIFKFEAQVGVFNYKNGPTYRCLYPNPPAPGDVPNCAEVGVLGVLPGIIGCLQANECIKIITGTGVPLSGKLMLFNALTLETQLLEVKPDKANYRITELIDYQEFCKGKESRETSVNEITVHQLKEKLARGEDIQIIDVREQYEYEICNIKGNLIPLGTLERQMDRISKDKPVVVLCHHGTRSAAAINFLKEKAGFTNLVNLKGGIHSWAMEIDTEMQMY